MLEGMPSSGGCPHHSGHLARVHHRHVHCSVLPSDPLGEQHVSRATVFPRNEESDLPDRSKARCHRGVVEMVPQVVVARDTLSTRATAHGMVAQGITEAVAGWTGPLLAVETEAKAIPGHHHKLLWPQVQPKSTARDHIEPITRVREG